MQSFGVSHPDRLPDRYLKFLQSLPLYCREDDFLLVHAGLDMTKEDPIAETRLEQMLWGDSTYLPGEEKLKGTTLVVGHKIRTMAEIRRSVKTAQIHLDNGACMGSSPDHGNLVALNLDTLQITAQSWLDGKAIF